MIKKILFLTLFLVSGLMAKVEHVWATPEFIDKKIKIIDIRTPIEWKEKGIIKGSYTITFFDENGDFDVEEFLKKLNKIVTKDEPFALICRVGSRTRILSDFLSEKLGYKVINLKGGIMHLIYNGYKTTPYQK